jgi:hypothetical protein
MLWWLERGKDSAELAWFLPALDRLALGIRLSLIGGKKRSRRFAAVVSAIRNNRDLKGPDSPLSFSQQEQRAIQHNLSNLHQRDAKAAKYLLLRLTDDMAGHRQSLLLPSDMTVEHVLPRKPSNNSQWRRWYPDPQQRERCTESLGNLVLVTRPQNDRAGNNEFARKQAVYFNTPNAPNPAINESLRGQTEWMAGQVLAREGELFRRIDAIWNLGVTAPAIASALADQGERRERPRKRA